MRHQLNPGYHNLSDEKQMCIYFSFCDHTILSGILQDTLLVFTQVTVFQSKRFIFTNLLKLCNEKAKEMQKTTNRFALITNELENIESNH